MIKIRNEDERYPYYEMARVGTVDNIDIIIRTDDPGKIPHFHFIDRDSKDKNNEGCIRIDKPEYFDHGYKNKHLNSKQIRKIIKFLSSSYRDPELNITNWKYLILLWNDNNSDVMIDDNYPMPDYTKLIGV